MVDKKVLEDFQVYAQGVKRLKELEKELNSLNTRKFKHAAIEIKKKLKNVHLIPEIENDLIDLKARIAGIDIRAERKKIDAEQNKKILELQKKEEELERKLGFALKTRLNEHETSEVESIPNIQRKISYIKNLFGQKNEKLQVGKEILESREEELDEKEKKLEKNLRKALRKKLSKRELEQLHNISHIQNRIFYLKFLLGKNSEEIEHLIAQTNKQHLSEFEIHSVKSIPGIKGKLDYLRLLIVKDEEEMRSFAALKVKINKISKKEIPNINGRNKILSRILKQNEEKMGLLEEFTGEFSDRLDVAIPSLQRKTSFLGRLFRKENEEIKQLENRVDQNSINFNKKLIAEIAESRRMLENEKIELRGQILDLLAESIKNLTKEKEESDNRILNQIEELKNEMQKNKEAADKNLIDKLLQIKQRVDESKKELKIETWKQINELQKEIELKKAIAISQGFKAQDQRKIEVLPELQKINVISERKQGEMPAEKAIEKLITIKPSQKTIPEFKKEEFLGFKEGFRDVPTIVDFAIYGKKNKEAHVANEISNLPEWPMDFKMPKLEKIHKTEIPEFKKKLIPATNEEIKREVEKTEKQKIKSELIKQEQKVKIKKIRIPNKAYLEYNQLIEIIRNINNLKIIFSNEHKEISRDINEKKEFHEGEINKLYKNFDEIKQNLSKISASFPLSRR